MRYTSVPASLRRTSAVLLCLGLGLGLALYWQDLRTHWLASIPPGGYRSDLYPRWLGTRELLLHGRNPYSESVTASIQQGFYGRVLGPDDAVRDQQAFAYPLMVVPLMAPFATMPYEHAVPLMLAAMLGALLLGVWAWAGALRPGQRTWAVGAALVPLVTLPVMEALLIHQLTALSLALLAAAGAFLWRGRLLEAGLALAVLTFKPQLALLPMLGAALWAISAPRQRWRLLLAYAGLAALYGLSELLVPGWSLEFLRAMHAYSGYVTLNLPLWFFLGRGSATAVASAAVVLGSLWMWWHARREPPESAVVQRAFLASIVATLVVVPEPSVYNKGLLVLPVLYLLAQPKARARSWRIVLVAQLAAIAYLSPALTGLLRFALGAQPPLVLELMPLTVIESLLPLATFAALLPAPGLVLRDVLRRPWLRVGALREHLHGRQA